MLITTYDVCETTDAAIYPAYYGNCTHVGSGDLEEETCPCGKVETLWVVANDTPALRNLEIKGMDFGGKIPGFRRSLEAPL